MSADGQEHLPPSDEQENPTAYRSHPRHFQGSQLVYPVLARRSGGVSIGVNLSPAQRCNFNCIYCQVQRDAVPLESPAVNQDRLEDELRQAVTEVTTGRLFRWPPFAATPVRLRRLNDIALSGDGEPTAAAEFLPACRLCAAIKEELGLSAVKIILLTNASLLHLPQVQEALALLDRHNGQVWAKLDAGTEAWFQRINQTDIPLARVLDNIRWVGRDRPIVIQSLFSRIDGAAPPAEEIAAYAARLADFEAAGVQLAAVQLYTIARPPRDPRVTALSSKELHRIAALVAHQVSTPLEVYPG